ncbi:MAG TPA: gas vesicle protein K [Chloroflexota bacterium]|jgi:hypothetical protein|nr:gas vesicle protein K [Chloroflexota bacterium]
MRPDPLPGPLPEGEGILPARINSTPEEVEQGLAKLVLSLIEFLRQVLERQAVRRMDVGDLSDEEIERMGLTLMRLEEKIVELAGQFGLSPEDLNLDLGPLGKLL